MMLLGQSVAGMDGGVVVVGKVGQLWRKGRGCCFAAIRA